MKLKSLERGSDDFVLGLILLALGVALIAAIYGCFLLYKRFGVVVLATPLILLKFKIAGHFINGWADPELHLKCPGCDYKFSNALTEWLHKRKCLPAIITEV